VRIAVLGAGAMGSAAAMLLARKTEVDIVVLDTDRARADGVVERAGRGEARALDASAGDLAAALVPVDAVAACLPYRLNLVAMEAALAARCPYADLGGLFHMTKRQLEMDEAFRSDGVPAVIGVGACPGLTNVCARLGADRLDTVHTIELFDGAREQRDEFGIPYSAETILDEFVMPAMVFEEGTMREAPAASGAMSFTFLEPVGEMEAFYTLHSELATLPGTIPGVRNVRWRLALPPAIAQGFRTLVGLGLASDEPIETGAGPVVPRELLLALLGRMPQPQGPPHDVEAMEIRVTGTRAGAPARFVAQTLFYPQPEAISAGAFGTALPITVCARWLAEGRVPPGVHPPEVVLDPEKFLEEVVAEGVILHVAMHEDIV